MDAAKAREVLLAGKRIRVVVEETTGPTLIVTLDRKMVVSESIAGWSAGVVEPVCALDSDYLQTFLSNRYKVEVV